MQTLHCLLGLVYTDFSHAHSSLYFSGWGWSVLWFYPSSLWHPLNEFSTVLCVWTQNNPFLEEKYKLGGPPPLVVGEPLRPEALIFNAWVPSSPIYCWLTVEKAPTKWYYLSGPTDNEKVIFSNHRFIIFCKICSERFKWLLFELFFTGNYITTISTGSGLPSSASQNFLPPCSFSSSAFTCFLRPQRAKREIGPRRRMLVTIG